MPDIKGVEIFAEGTWNGNDITSDVLKSIVSGFESTKSFVRPVLKLGHSEEQSLLRNEGLPAAGWVSNVYIQGKKLLGDFVDIPQKIYDLIKKKAYRKVSIELCSGYTFDDQTYPYLLTAVALLGAELPAVKTISDILGLYKTASQNFTNDIKSNKIETKIFTQDLAEEDIMSDKPVLSEKEISDRINAEVDKKLAAFQVTLDKAKAENDELKTNFAKHKDESEKKISTLEIQKTEVEIEKFASDLQSKGLIAPSMAPFIKSLIGSTSKLEFSVADKKYSSQQALEEILKLAKATYATNKTEHSKDLDPPKTDTEKDLEKQIKEYMLENKIDSYSIAYREVLKKNAVK